MSTIVQLREVCPDDLPIFFEQQLDPEATRMAGFPSRDRDRFMAHWEKILADGSNTIRAVVYRGRVAGNIVCFEQEGRLLVGYWIGREFWGRGIATEAVKLFLRIVENRPLFAFVAAHNVASIRVLEKCGFTMSNEQPAPHDGDPAERMYELI